MREVAALLRLDRLNATTAFCQHAAGTISVVRIYQRQTSPIALQATIALDKGFFRHFQIRGNGRYIVIRQADISFPAAAGTATLAGMDDGFRWLVHISHGLRIGAVM